MPYDGKSEGRSYGIFPKMFESPIAIPGAGKIFTKESGGGLQLFYQDETGTETQLSPASALGAVSSVFGRNGVVVAALNDYTSSLVQNLSGVAGATVTNALNTLAGLIPSVPVASVFGRIGAVVAAQDDYGSNLIDNQSGVTGDRLTDALNNLNTGITDLNSLKAEKAFTANAYAGSGRDIDAGDLDAMIVTSSGSAVAINIPLNSTYNAPLNRIFQVFQDGTGAVSITATGGVTLNSLGGLVACSGRYGLLSFWQTATNVWKLTGNLA